jgi:hypothetical protein
LNTSHFQLIGRTAEQVLNDDKYFLCKRNLATFNIKHCIERQTRRNGDYRKGFDIPYVPEECLKCPQGIKNLNLFNKIV